MGLTSRVACMLAAVAACGTTTDEIRDRFEERAQRRLATIRERVGRTRPHEDAEFYAADGMRRKIELARACRTWVRSRIDTIAPGVGRESVVAPCLKAIADGRALAPEAPELEAALLAFVDATRHALGPDGPPNGDGPGSDPAWLDADGRLQREVEDRWLRLEAERIDRARTEAGETLTLSVATVRFRSAALVWCLRTETSLDACRGAAAGLRNAVDSLSGLCEAPGEACAARFWMDPFRRSASRLAHDATAMVERERHTIRPQDLRRLETELERLELDATLLETAPTP